MSDELQDNGPPSPPEVDLRNRSNVRYWCKRWSVTEPELREAVQRAGVSAPAVAFALGREAY